MAVGGGGRLCGQNLVAGQHLWFHLVRSYRRFSGAPRTRARCVVADDAAVVARNKRLAVPQALVCEFATSVTRAVH